MRPSKIFRCFLGKSISRGLVPFGVIDEESSYFFHSVILRWRGSFYFFGVFFFGAAGLRTTNPRLLGRFQYWLAGSIGYRFLRLFFFRFLGCLRRGGFFSVFRFRSRFLLSTGTFKTFTPDLLSHSLRLTKGIGTLAKGVGVVSRLLIEDPAAVL